MASVIVTGVFCDDKSDVTSMSLERKKTQHFRSLNTFRNKVAFKHSNDFNFRSLSLCINAIGVSFHRAMFCDVVVEARPWSRGSRH